MNLLLKEYMLSGDGAEAERCVRDLEVPHFHHEFVYEVKPASPLDPQLHTQYFLFSFCYLDQIWLST